MTPHILIPNEQNSDIGISKINAMSGKIRPIVFCIVSFIMQAKVIHIFFILHLM